MRINLTEQEIALIRGMIDYDELHARKLYEWEHRFEAPQLQQNIINYIAKKSLSRRIDYIMTLKAGDNDLTDVQCANLARSLENKLERDVKATHRLYGRTDSGPVLENLAREELLPAFMLLDKLRDY